MAFILLCVSSLLACFLMLEVNLHRRTRIRLKASRVKANQWLNESIDHLHELASEKGQRHHAETLSKQLATENGRLSSLIDFDGKINPLHFKSNALFVERYDLAADRLMSRVTLHVQPLAFHMDTACWDFSQVPNTIPHVARCMARAMTRRLEDELAAQVEGVVKAGAEQI